MCIPLIVILHLQNEYAQLSDFSTMKGATYCFFKKEKMETKCAQVYLVTSDWKMTRENVKKMVVNPSLLQYCGTEGKVGMGSGDGPALVFMSKNRCLQISRTSESETGDRKICLPDARDS